MTLKKMNFYRNALENRLSELNQSFGRQGITIDRTADAFDSRLLAADREIAARKLEASAIKVREARSALERLDHGEFGTCPDCLEPISDARLQAVPWASRCFQCQESAEDAHVTERCRQAYAAAA